MDKEVIERWCVRLNCEHDLWMNPKDRRDDQHLLAGWAEDWCRERYGDLAMYTHLDSFGSETAEWRSGANSAAFRVRADVTHTDPLLAKLKALDKLALTLEGEKDD